MKKTNIFFTFATLFILNGCVSTSNFYILSVASQPKVTYAHQNDSIGVEAVTIPAYLYKRDIAYAKSAREISFVSDANWGEDLDKGLTHRLIAFLQKKFNQPRVYEYPWGTDNHPDKKIRLTISRFIAYKDKVYLDANWDIKKISTKQNRAKLFQTTVQIEKAGTDGIVDAMNMAFGELEEAISKGVKSF